MQIISTLVAVVTLILVVFVLFTSLVFRDSQIKKMQFHLQNDAAQLAPAIASALWNYDTVQLDNVLDGAMKYRDLTGILVQAETIRSARGRNGRWETIYGDPVHSAGDMVRVEPVNYNGVRLGSITLYATTRFLEREMWNWIYGFVGSILFLDLLLVFGLYLILKRIVVTPLRYLQTYAVQVSSGASGVSLITEQAFCGELEVLRSATQKMVDLLQSRNLELQQEAKRHRESEQRFRTLVDTIPELIWLKDTEGTYLACNTMFERFYGKPEKEIVGRNDYDFVEKGLAESFRGNDLRAVALGKEHYNEEWVTLADTGEKMCLETINTPMFNTEGRLIGVLGVGHDITHRKQFEELLSQERDRAQGYLDTVEALIVALSRDGSINTLNRKACEILGYNEEELLGCSWFDICCESPSCGGYSYDYFVRLMAGEAENLEYQMSLVITKSGEQRHIAWHTSLLRDEEGAIVGTLSAGEDITERTRSEEETVRLKDQLYQAQKMESIGRLAGGVAHDFNNMLTVILGHVELAIMKLDPLHEVQVNLEQIRNSGQRSANLTRQLLGFARKQTIVPKSLNLNDAVVGILTMLQRLISEEISLHWHPAPHLWLVKMDPTQLDQILTNLCVNARDAITGVGIITIETATRTINPSDCAAYPDALPGEYVVLSVSDNGCGMDEETVSHVYEPFFTTKAVGEGTGLGLSTVYGIVKQNNGFIHLFSKPGAGTTFSIHLPRCLAEEAPVQNDTDEQPLQGGNEAILLVEDQQDILDLTVVMLEGLGYRVLGASSIGESIRLAKEHVNEIKLLITDVIMPELNGRDLASTISSFSPQLKVLFISGYTPDFFAGQGVLDSGVNFMQKPFCRRELAAKVRQVLDQ
jgi:PAS domain S-box-containing protein